MPKRYRERSLHEFQKEFSTEEACAQHLREMRWPDGFRCPRCGHGEAWLIRTRNILDCKSCRAKISLTAGTIFHKTRTPLVKWYWLIYHMAMDKVGVSISEMQRVLEIRDYKTAWLMGHKIRKAMADRDAGYSLAGLVEMDDSFFGPKVARKVEAVSGRVQCCVRYRFIGIAKEKRSLVLHICRWLIMRRHVPLRASWKDLAMGRRQKKAKIL